MDDLLTLLGHLDLLTLAIGFASGVPTGIALDHWIIPTVIDAWRRFARTPRRRNGR